MLLGFFLSLNVVVLEIIATFATEKHIPRMEKRYDVFISHSTQDKKVVGGICSYLERNGYRCFVDIRDIPAGVDWTKAIPQAINASKMMVVVFSNACNDSSDTDREIGLASDKMPILTYRVEDAKMTGTKEYYLRNLSWIDAFPNPENFFGKLLDNVKKLIGPSSLMTKESVELEEGSLAKEATEKEQLEPEKQAPKQKTAPQKKKSLPWIIAVVIVLTAFITILLIFVWPRPEPELTSTEPAQSVDSVQPVVSETDSGDLIINVNGVSFVMKPVEGGTFRMGGTDSEAYSNEHPVHSVTVSTFYMGETEVTQALWKAVLGSTPSYFTGDNLPVESVSYNKIMDEFLPELNRLTGKNFRLPSEAEWEYAARGGNRSSGYKYAGSNSVNDVAWYTVTTNDSGTKTVKTEKLPNELGLYDMSGNVWEWCQDWYGRYCYTNGSQVNPQGLSSRSSRVLRGGGWDDGARYCRVSHRSYYNPDEGFYRIGFRLVLS